MDFYARYDDKYFHSRSTGHQYGGKLIVSYIGYFDTVFKRFYFDQLQKSTVARRLNVHGISIRCMIVVSIVRCTNKLIFIYKLKL